MGCGPLGTSQAEPFPVLGLPGQGRGWGFPANGVEATVGTDKTNMSSLLPADTGTAVMILFTSDVDLFFAIATSVGRKICLSLVRRVLTLPSGLVGEFDL